MAAAALAVAISGCGDRVCGDSIVDEGEGAPRIESFDLDGQLPEDPWLLVFTLGFRDANGDLSAGVVNFYLDRGTKPSPVELERNFEDSDVASDATAGVLTIPLLFPDKFAPGARVRISAQLVDGAGLRSNCYRLDLSFAADRTAGNAGAGDDGKPSIRLVSWSACGGDAMGAGVGQFRGRRNSEWENDAG